MQNNSCVIFFILICRITVSLFRHMLRFPSKDVRIASKSFPTDIGLVESKVKMDSLAAKNYIL